MRRYGRLMQPSSEGALPRVSSPFRQPSPPKFGVTGSVDRQSHQSAMLLLHAKTRRALVKGKPGGRSNSILLDRFSRGRKGRAAPGGGGITCSLDPSACSRSRARSRTHRAWASYAQLLRASGSPSASGIAARMLLTCSASAPLVPSTRRLMTLNGPPTEGRSGEGQGISGASYPEWGGLLTW